MKMLVDKDALRERIASDPDVESEARGPAVTPMTPEARMTDAIKAAVAEWDKDSLMDDRSEREESRRLLYIMRKHGTDAIQAAVAEAERVQKARIVAWLRQGWPNVMADEMGKSFAQSIRDGEPEAWAARTGWAPP